MLELLKLVVQPVILERDPDGQIVGERVGEQAALYTTAQVMDFMVELQHQVEIHNAEVNNAGQRDHHPEHRLRQPGLPREHAQPG